MNDKTVVCKLKHSRYPDVDFTGRWKVVSDGDNTKLELECFYLRMERRERYTGEQEYIKYDSPNWFMRMLGRKDVYRIRDQVEYYTKWVHPLGYVDSDNLIVEEIYINTCGVMNDE